VKTKEKDEEKIINGSSSSDLEKRREGQHRGVKEKEDFQL